MPVNKLCWILANPTPDSLIQPASFHNIALSVADKPYQIPLRLWLPKAFPKERPTVQIHPSPDMELTSVNYVDADGKVTLPYLTDWKEVCM